MRNIDETIQDMHRISPSYSKKIEGYHPWMVLKGGSHGYSKASEQARLEKMKDDFANKQRKDAEPDIVPTHAKMSGTLPQPAKSDDKSDTKQPSDVEKSDVEKSSDALCEYFKGHQ